MPRQDTVVAGALNLGMGGGVQLVMGSQPAQWLAVWGTQGKFPTIYRGCSWL